MWASFPEKSSLLTPLRRGRLGRRPPSASSPCLGVHISCPRLVPKQLPGSVTTESHRPDGHATGLGAHAQSSTPKARTPLHTLTSPAEETLKGEAWLRPHPPPVPGVSLWTGSTWSRRSAVWEKGKGPDSCPMTAGKSPDAQSLSFPTCKG